MSVEKIFFKNFDDRIVLPALFVTAAIFAGSKRTIHLFEGSCAGGLFLSAVAGSACVYGVKTFGEDECEELYDLTQKCLAVAIAVIVSPIVCKLLAERVSLSMYSSLKFGMVEAGIILTAHFALPFLKEVPEPYLPTEKVDLQTIETELREIERTSTQKWHVKQAVTDFNVDEILDVLAEDDVIDNNQFREIYSLGDYPVIDHDVAQLLEQNLNRYRGGGLGEQEQEVKRYAQKIFGYLIQKKNAWQVEQDPRRRSEVLESVSNLIRHTVTSFNDAHRDCVDQVLSQVENLAIMVVDDYGCSEFQKLVALKIISYRSALIKEVVAQTGEEHAADLERALSANIHAELSLPLPKCISVGAAFNNIFDRGNFQTAKRNFLARYHPLEYLIDQISYHTERKLFTVMSQWYNNTILFELDETVKDRVVKQLGTDFLMGDFEKRTRESVIYFLLKGGVVEKPV